MAVRAAGPKHAENLKPFRWPKGVSGNPKGRPKGISAGRLTKVVDAFLYGVNSRQQTRLEESLEMIWRSGDEKLIGGLLPVLMRYSQAPPPSSIRIQYENTIEVTLRQVWDEERKRVRELPGGQAIEAQLVESPGRKMMPAFELSDATSGGDLPKAWDVDEWNPGWAGITDPAKSK